MQSDTDSDTEAEDVETLVLDRDLEVLAGELAAHADELDRRLAESEEAALGTAAVAGRDLAAARRLCDALRGREEQLWAMNEHAGVMISEWVANVPFDLAHHDRLPDALTLSEALEPLLGPEEARGDRAMILAQAGRTEEARELARALAAAHEGDGEVTDRVAEIFAEIGDGPRAEECSWRAIELSLDPIVQLAARERLVRLLRRRGANEEAAALEEEIASMDEELDEAQFPSTFPPAHVCPCGSGKAYGECCGATDA
jgi:hypothetical protein